MAVIARFARCAPLTDESFVDPQVEHDMGFHDERKGSTHVPRFGVTISTTTPSFAWDLNHL